ncbi:MAG: hypothetical protein Q9161_006037 [Pseudevernia consocians]
MMEADKVRRFDGSGILDGRLMFLSNTDRSDNERQTFPFAWVVPTRRAAAHQMEEPTIGISLVRSHPTTLLLPVERENSAATCHGCLPSLVSSTATFEKAVK